MLTFALMLASLGLGMVIYSRTRLRWLRAYLVYLICYAGWILFSSYFFFQAVYLPVPAEQPYLFAVVFRVLVSLAILYAGPLFALRISELPVDVREWWLLSIPVAFVFGTVLVFYSTGSSRVAIVPNGVFNGYLAALFLVASLRTTSRMRTAGQGDTLRRAFVPFLWFSVGAYAALFAANILEVGNPGLFSSSLIDDGFAAAFCFILSVITIPIFIAHLRDEGRTARPHSLSIAMPSELIETFDLTERERAIAGDLVSGMRSGEIADKYFISPRSVESQVDTIYRKCAVTNRVELLRLLEHYRSGEA